MMQLKGFLNHEWIGDSKQGVIKLRRVRWNWWVEIENKKLTEGQVQSLLWTDAGSLHGFSERQNKFVEEDTLRAITWEHDPSDQEAPNPILPIH